jgi:hypothetical protein
MSATTCKANRVISHISRVAIYMTDMTSQQYWWRIQSCGMWRRVDSYLGTNASEQRDASFFSAIQEDSSWTILKIEAVS